jgi:hypothetical protein
MGTRWSCPGVSFLGALFAGITGGFFCDFGEHGDFVRETLANQFLELFNDPVGTAPLFHGGEIVYFTDELFRAGKRDAPLVWCSFSPGHESRV